MRVVLDTNVIVSSFLVLQGKSAQIMQDWRQRTFDMVVSEALLQEYTRVLGYERTRKRHGLTWGDIDEVIVDLRQSATLVTPTESLNVIDADPDDNKLIECAVAGGADYIVSGDTHLLSLAEYRGIKIVSPATFLLVLNKSNQ